jgi:hypothetical protein
MKLITKEVEEKLLKNPIYSGEGTPDDEREIIVKFFTPWTCWTWYVLEASKQDDGDWEFFGYVCGHEREMGYFRLSDLTELEGPGGLKIERDMYFGKHFLSELKNGGSP